MSARREAVRPEAFTTEALHCAIAACQHSRHESDRRFAEACRRELATRLPLRKQHWMQRELRDAA